MHTLTETQTTSFSTVAPGAPSRRLAMLGLATLAIVLLASLAFAISRHTPTDVSTVDASPWVVATSGPGSNSWNALALRAD